MSNAANECIPYREEADRIPCFAKEAVTGKRCVKVVAALQSGPGLSTGPDGGNIQIGPATAGGVALGVASHDAAAKERVTVINEGIIPITAGKAIKAGEEVGIGAEGKVVKAEDPSEAEVKEGKLHKVRAVGMAMSDAAEGADCPVLWYGAPR